MNRYVCFAAALLIAASAGAQVVGGGPVIGGGGSGGVPSDSPTFTTKITTPSIVGGASGTSTLTLDGDSTVAGSASVSANGDITSDGPGQGVISRNYYWTSAGSMFLISNSGDVKFYPSNTNAGYISTTLASLSVPLLSPVLVEANTAVAAGPNILTAAESKTLLTNEGIAAQNYHTLPLAAAGLCFEFAVQDADGIRIVANTSDTIRIAANVSAAAGYIQNSTIGSTIKLCAINAVEWFSMGTPAGTWTIDS